MNKKQRKERIYTLFRTLPKGWGWYYLSTVIDDYSRYIIHWELCSSMTSDDVSRTIDKAIEKAGVTFQNPPCLLSDNGPCYIASSLKQYLCKEYNIRHIHRKPCIRRRRERQNDITDR